MEFTLDQQKAYRLMSSGENVFLTGEAGTGKSFLLNKFIEENKNKNILVTAPTGIAAIEIGGATLHRTFKIPIKDLHRINKGPVYIDDILESANILIIDEISMCRLDVFEYVLKAIELATKKRGGKPYQIILVGDFLQLPPILANDEAELYKTLYGHASVFPFFSPLWESFHFKTIELKEVVRQQGDRDLIDNLNRARRGDVSCIQYFNKFVTPYESFNSDAIFVCSTNRTASEFNRKKIDELPGRSRVYRADILGDVKYSDKPTDDELELKEGTRVMTLINNPDEGYSNGSMGTCVALRKDSVIVEMDNGPRVEISAHEWVVKEYRVTEKIDDQGKKVRELSLQKVGSFEQLPLKIAFAITIHKSQGQTFDNVIVDPMAWDSGQLYVALSRVRSSKGLQLSREIARKYLIANHDVLDFYSKSSFVTDHELDGMEKKKEEKENQDSSMLDSFDLFGIQEEEVKEARVVATLKAMYFPESFDGFLHEASDCLLSNDKQRFLELADKYFH